MTWANDSVSPYIALKSTAIATIDLRIPCDTYRDTYRQVNKDRPQTENHRPSTVTMMMALRTN